ncbi:MAG: helix-turn-helix domain-containing protein [Acidobacteriaceae bacterium]|nr:helix-turn-helix domain-containing protein [Acidobacteriaceae bacterium]
MTVTNSLQEIRKKRKLSAAELAQRVGVSRQTIYAIEGGVFVPNTAVSLELSRVLDVTVEEIFSLTEQQTGEPVKADLLPIVQVNQGQPVRLCRMQGRLVAVPATFMPGYLPAADGIIESRKNASVLVKSPVSLPAQGERLILAGCDPALSLLQDALRPSAIEIVSVLAASRLALDWLKQGKIHVAGSHLLDHATGNYNVPIIRRLLPKASLRVITFAVWEQGLVVKRGNPKSIRSVADLARNGVTIVNREKGAGSRDLLDSSLRQLRIPFKRVKGYRSIATGHLEAAYAVAAGHADCCIASRSAARCFALDFVPLAVERFDLSFTKACLESTVARALIDVLHRSDFRKKLQFIAGYDTTHTGEVLV